MARILSLRRISGELMSGRIRQADDDARSSDLIAFCHIEKAAGTSLTHVLRRVFFLRYVAVRPYDPGHGHYFSLADLRVVRRCNPWVRAIGGHSVVPHSDLVTGPHSVRFITQLRDPVARAASQYRFWVSRLDQEPDPDSFLQHHASRNFQVRKIAGAENLDLAKSMIRKHFLLAGTVSRFDEFLVLLARSLGRPLEEFVYERKNIASARPGTDIPDDFHARLRSRNELDQALYDWVDSELIPEYIDRYGPDFAADLAKFQALQKDHTPTVLHRWIDSIYRNGYLKPVTGLLRLRNGLPYSGSYAHTTPRRRKP